MEKKINTKILNTIKNTTFRKLSLKSRETTNLHILEEVMDTNTVIHAQPKRPTMPVQEQRQNQAEAGPEP